MAVKHHGAPAGERRQERISTVGLGFSLASGRECRGAVRHSPCSPLVRSTRLPRPAPPKSPTNRHPARPHEPWRPTRLEDVGMRRGRPRCIARARTHAREAFFDCRRKNTCTSAGGGSGRLRNGERVGTVVDMTGLPDAGGPERGLGGGLQALNLRPREALHTGRPRFLPSWSASRRVVGTLLRCSEASARGLQGGPTSDNVWKAYACVLTS